MNVRFKFKNSKLKRFNKQGSSVAYSFIKNIPFNQTNKSFLTVLYPYTAYCHYTYNYHLLLKLISANFTSLKATKKTRKNITIKVMCMVLDSVAFTVNAEGGFSIIIVSALWYIKRIVEWGQTSPIFVSYYPPFRVRRPCISYACVKLSHRCVLYYRPTTTPCTVHKYIRKTVLVLENV